MGLNVAAGIERHPGRTTDGRLHIGIGETHAPGRQSIDIRCLQAWMTRTAQIVEAKLVEHDEQDIFCTLGHGDHPIPVGTVSPAMFGTNLPQIGARGVRAFFDLMKSPTAHSSSQATAGSLLYRVALRGWSGLIPIDRKMLQVSDGHPAPLKGPDIEWFFF